MGKTQDSVVKIRLLVQCNMRSGFVDLYLSARFLAPIEARLRPAKQKDNVIIDPFWQKHLQERLLQSRVELWANLSEFVIPLHRLRSLKKGDVLPLEKGPDSLIDLVIDSRILARGRMGRSTGKIAVKIEDTHVNSMPKDF
jgi:flagellar motor switch protein FliM